MYSIVNIQTWTKEETLITQILKLKFIQEKLMVTVISFKKKIILKNYREILAFLEIAIMLATQ